MKIKAGIDLIYESKFVSSEQPLNILQYQLSNDDDQPDYQSQ